MSYVSDKIKQLVKKHKTNNPFEIADNLNIIVHLLPMHDEINGFYKLEQRNRFIIINQNLSTEIQRFVCAHELGHAILHPRSNTPFMRQHTLFSVDRIEVEANTFAVELLLTDQSIYEYKHTNLSIYEICEMYGIPRELAHLKKF